VLRFVLIALDPTKWQLPGCTDSDAASWAPFVADLLYSSLCRTDQFWTWLQTIWQRVIQNLEADRNGTGPARLAAVISICLKMMVAPVDLAAFSRSALTGFPVPLDAMQRACLVVARIWTLPNLLIPLPGMLRAQLTAPSLVPSVLGAMHTMLDLYGEQVDAFFEAHGPDRSGAPVALARCFANVCEWVGSVVWTEHPRDIAVHCWNMHHGRANATISIARCACV
jgi:hypothetical protein